MSGPLENIEEITELIRGSVPEDSFSDACELLEMYSNDHIALTLLHEFYDSLPGTVADGVLEIRILGQRQGVYLLVAVTGAEGYIYLSSIDGLELQGTVSEGIWDPEVVDYFQLEDPKNVLGNRNSIEDLAIYEPLSANSSICPSCCAITGELHELGCPVEVCPWCGGQFIGCNCRFEQLGQDTITEETDLQRLENMLEERGRIPYEQDQRPAFPSVV